MTCVLAPVAADERDAPLDPLALIGLDAVSAPLYLHGGARILYANAAMQRLLGYSLEELQRLRHDEWARHDFRAGLRAYGERCLREGGQLPAHEV